MPITVCGINHKTAPLSLREKVVFPLERLPLYLADILQHENINEAVILSTCNRSEVYCEIEDTNKIIQWFCSQHQITREELDPYLYIYQDEEAIEHMMRVACGIDSMVMGESQILGQMKNAFTESCAAGVVGPLFNRLFQQIFAIAKEVRANTAIGACPVSVASATVGLAKQLSSELNTVLVVGAGDTADLLLRYLTKENTKRILITNRSAENANTLAQKHHIESIPFADMPDALRVADIVITATGSLQPVITKSMVESVMSLRQDSTLTLIDIAVPRDVDVAVADLPSIRLYCIDDLKSMIQNHMRGREHAAEKAQEMIKKKTEEFTLWQKSLDQVATTIRAYRAQVEELCQAELIKATKQLQRGDDPLQVVSLFAYSFMNKMMHTPSVQLRQAGFEGRFEILEFAQQLFAIPQVDTEPL